MQCDEDGVAGVCDVECDAGLCKRGFAVGGGGDGDKVGIEAGGCCEDPTQDAASSDELLARLRLAEAIGTLGFLGCEERMAGIENVG